MEVAASSASAEWRKYFMLPISAGMGIAVAAMLVMALSSYIEPISEEFGWSRTLTTAGLSLALIMTAVASIPVGMLVDRIGPRPLALFGIPLYGAAFALLGTATGDAGNWYMLWVFMGVGYMFIPPTVWTSAVATRFDASRGLAFAVTLSGGSFALALLPILATTLIEAFGWRTAFAAQAGIWLLLTYPLIFLFFRGANDRQRGKRAQVKHERPVLSGAGFLEGLRSTIYVRLLMVKLLFPLTIWALAVHFVPIATNRGLSPVEAAGIASFIGIGSLIGRLGTGILIDRFPASLVGAIIFVLPVMGCALLLAADNGSFAAAAIAAATLGVTLGAEVDVIAYLASRYFGLKSFGALYGGLLVGQQIGGAVGPLGAAMIFDAYGSYNLALWLAIGFMTTCSLALVSLPRPKVVGAAQSANGSATGERSNAAHGPGA